MKVVHRTLAALLLAQVTALQAVSSLAAEPVVQLEETFNAGLSKDWFWGLGTWTARDGVLRGFESGSRRHGPVQMRRFPFKNGCLECEFRLEGQATFAGIIFNGSQERGHIVHLVMGKDQLRILAHPHQGGSLELLKQPHVLARGAWHRAQLEFQGPVLTAMVNDVPLAATNQCLAEEKLTFGLGGDSGGPEGEKAGALEFRRLKVSAKP